MKIFGEAARAVWNRKALWAVQGVGNLVALTLAWAWFSLPDSEVWQVAASGVLGAIAVCAILLFHGATLAAYHQDAGVPWRATVKRLPALLAWLVVLVGALWGVLRWIPSQRSVWRTEAIAGAVMILLPLLNHLSARGFRPGGLRACLNWRYPAGFAVAAILGAYLPMRLVWWVPEVEGIASQAASMGARFLLAYLLAVASWLLLASLVGRLSAENISRQS
jgi:hypothetical protein